MSFNSFPIREISTVAILVPIALNASLLSTAKVKLWLFFVFLIAGLATDILGWYASTHTELIELLLFIVTCYSVLESIFFTWWTTQHANLKSLRILGIVILIVIACWISFLILNGINVSAYNTSRLTLFDVFYQIAVSFLSGFTLLVMIEKEENPSILPMFWILVGIFFYCFSTFFVFVIKATIDKGLADTLWPVHNVVNIITYFFYSVGLWKYRKIEKSKA